MKVETHWETKWNCPTLQQWKSTSLFWFNFSLMGVCLWSSCSQTDEWSDSLVYSVHMSLFSVDHHVIAHQFMVFFYCKKKIKSSFKICILFFLYPCFFSSQSQQAAVFLRLSVIWMESRFPGWFDSRYGKHTESACERLLLFLWHS